jgi:hypothetical protein
MQCGQGKPFTVTSTNPKMGGTAVRSYEKGGVVTKPTGTKELNLQLILKTAEFIPLKKVNPRKTWI